MHAPSLSQDFRYSSERLHSPALEMGGNHHWCCLLSVPQRDYEIHAGRQHDRSCPLPRRKLDRRFPTSCATARLGMFQAHAGNVTRTPVREQDGGQAFKLHTPSVSCLQPSEQRMNCEAC